MEVTHDEADTIIIQQVMSIRKPRVLTVADDTDVFVLLCHLAFHGYIDGDSGNGVTN